MKLRLKKLMLLGFCCYIVFYICIVLHVTSSDREREFLSLLKNVHVIKLFFPEKSSCLSDYKPAVKHTHVSRNVQIEKIEDDSKMCFIHESSNVDIQIEKEWDRISTEYPHYVLTVSGWLEVVQIPSYREKWSDRPLKVVIIPHSHQDPGWLSSYSSYFSSNSKPTLDLAKSFLDKKANWKFIWAEVTYFADWWKQQKIDSKKLVMELINRKQFEMVTGGWVMTDEATAHYSAMLDQLIEGHHWLKNNLGVFPNSSWAIDPFGHSPTMAYLLNRSGIKNMVIQRVHFGIKKYLAQQQNLEFNWRQTWDSTGSTDMFCHLMPFLLYSISHSCGPDPHVCCQYDFHQKKCYWGRKLRKTVTVNEKNIKQLSWDLWKEYQKKSQIYRTNVLLVPHGDDFRYSFSEEWNAQFENLEKLMKYMNENKRMNIQIQFGTVSDFFETMQNERSMLTGREAEIPSLSGDFFTYNDRDDQYWSGFYTSRPFYKHMSRVLMSKLRTTEIWTTLTLQRLSENGNLTPTQQWDTHMTGLAEIRQAQSLFQHHDAITGTSKSYVMDDYASRLHNALTNVDRLLSNIVKLSMVKNGGTDDGTVKIHLNEEWKTYNSLPTTRVLAVNKSRKIIVMNSLTIERKEVIRLTVNSENVQVTDSAGEEVPYQINPVWTDGVNISTIEFQVAFEVKVPSMSMVTYKLIPVTNNWKARVTVFNLKNAQLNERLLNAVFDVNILTTPVFQVQTTILSLIFGTCDGMLRFMKHNIDDVWRSISAQFVIYRTGHSWTPGKDKSGAYIFLPDGSAEDLSSPPPRIHVIEGRIMSTVYVYLQNITQIVTIYNISGPMSAGIHIENKINLDNKKWDNTELVMRIKSDIKNYDKTFCTDLNGYQFHRRKTRSKMKIQGNFYPMTTQSFIEDEQNRLTLHTTEAHGLACLEEGWIETVLDRRLMQHDWRGLNEGITDNKLTRSIFFLLLEKKVKSITVSDRPACFPSLLSHTVSSLINNPAVVFIAEKGASKLRDMTIGLPGSLPCDVFLVNYRTTIISLNDSSVESLLVLHKYQPDCDFKNLFMDCKKDKNGLDALKTRRSTIFETQLTGVKEEKSLDGKELKLESMELKTFKVRVTV